MRRTIFACVAAIWMAAVGVALGFPYATSTGTFNSASVPPNDWSQFFWNWSDQNYTLISVNFNGLTTPSTISNVYLRLAYPEKGPTYLTINTGTITPGSTNIAWATPSPLAPSNIPPNRTYYAEFQAVSSSGETRSLAKGKIRTDWSLYSITNATSWVPISVVYAGSGTVTIVESDPIHVAWLSTYAAYVAAQAGSNVLFQAFDSAQKETNAYFESAKTNLQTQIVTETNRAYVAETNLQAQIVTETNRAYGVETNLQTQIVTETNRAYVAETNLQAQIVTETNRAYGVETNLQTQIVTETNRAYGVEAALSEATNALDTRVTGTEGFTNEAHTAYGWGNHALAGYLSATTNIFQRLYVADRSQLGANLSGLDQATYVGDVISVAYTGKTVLVAGYTYVFGFTKANAFGTSVLSIASQSLSGTAAGGHSNYFTYSGTDTNLILTLSGDGSSKSDVTAVYVKQITNGSASVAGDLYVGGGMYVNGSLMTNPAEHILSSTNAHGGVAPLVSYVASSNLLDTVVANLGAVSGSVNVVTGNIGSVSGTLDTAIADLSYVSNSVVYTNSSFWFLNTNNSGGYNAPD